VPLLKCEHFAVVFHTVSWVKASSWLACPVSFRGLSMNVYCTLSTVSSEIGGHAECLPLWRQTVSVNCLCQAYMYSLAFGSVHTVFKTVSALPSLIWFHETTTHSFVHLCHLFLCCNFSASSSCWCKEQSTCLKLQIMSCISSVYIQIYSFTLTLSLVCWAFKFNFFWTKSKFLFKYCTRNVSSIQETTLVSQHGVMWRPGDICLNVYMISYQIWGKNQYWSLSNC
jgi:hypothetical protein